LKNHVEKVALARGEIDNGQKAPQEERSVVQGKKLTRITVPEPGSSVERDLGKQEER